MSAHSEIVRDYIELRNFLAQSHPQPNLKFDVEFDLVKNRLLARSSLTKAGIEIIGVQPNFWRLYLPPSALRFEIFSLAMIKYINERLPKTTKSLEKSILTLAVQYKNNLDLKAGYEPKS